eukprot:GHRR01005294.1.p1 GENE.GHRR01005294.1~~GHRR01005294.1.p1  ORF type:complete len:211 (+),score=33.95 GHRR01005294.1:181-813(+)
MVRGPARHLARLARAYAETARHGANAQNGPCLGRIAGEALPGSAASLQHVRGQAQAVRAEVRVEPQVQVVPEITTDLFGAISPVSDAEIHEGMFRNIDGHRFDDGRYQAFREELQQFIGQERVYTDPVRTFAYGTDASFYRLNPKIVVKVHNEAEIRRIMPIAKRHGVPITFRAAGTSLSGQALTDSVLLKLSHTGKNFRNYTIHVSVIS